MQVTPYQSHLHFLLSVIYLKTHHPVLTLLCSGIMYCVNQNYIRNEYSTVGLCAEVLAFDRDKKSSALFPHFVLR